MCAALDVSPLAGRDGRPAAHTSRAVTGRVGVTAEGRVFGTTEVDYILAPNSWTTDRYEVHEPPPWEGIPTAITHRMISATITIPARDGAAAPAPPDDPPGV